jgi:hypothetical protein
MNWKLGIFISGTFLGALLICHFDPDVHVTYYNILCLETKEAISGLFFLPKINLFFFC